tara:strand:- start:2137 stop:2829 length:693 start_codon:yes stop_codon:yes gene_type:complete
MSESHVLIIMPAFNAVKFIEECALSIQAQTYTSWRGVIVDDGSSDGTFDAATALAKKDKRWSVIRKANGGAPSAVNAALQDLSPSAWAVAFCDSDDLWLQDKLEKQVALAQSHSADEPVWAIGTLIEEFNSFQKDSPRSRAARPGSHKHFCRTNALLSRQLIQNLGAMDEDKHIGDFVNWISPALNRGLKPQFVKEVLTRRRIHENNLTVKPDKREFLEILRAHMQGRQD